MHISVRSSSRSERASSGRDHRPPAGPECASRAAPYAALVMAPPAWLSTTTGVSKEVIAQVAENIGGVARMTKWVRESKENERAFWTSIYTKLLPLQVAGDPPVRFVGLAYRPSAHSVSDEHYRRPSTRITCVADQLPVPRAVGMPRSFRPAAISRRDVAPAACSSVIVGAVWQHEARPASWWLPRLPYA